MADSDAPIRSAFRGMLPATGTAAVGAWASAVVGVLIALAEVDGLVGQVVLAGSDLLAHRAHRPARCSPARRRRLVVGARRAGERRPRDWPGGSSSTRRRPRVRRPLHAGGGTPAPGRARPGVRAHRPGPRAAWAWPSEGPPTRPSRCSCSTSPRRRLLPRLSRGEVGGARARLLSRAARRAARRAGARDPPRTTRTRPPAGGPVRRLLALYTHRFSLLVVVPFAALGLAKGTDVLDQLPDVQRQWVDSGAGSRIAVSAVPHRRRGRRRGRRRPAAQPLRRDARPR